MKTFIKTLLFRIVLFVWGFVFLPLYIAGWIYNNFAMAFNLGQRHQGKFINNMIRYLNRG